VGEGRRRRNDQEADGELDVGPEVSGAIVKRFQVTRPREKGQDVVNVSLPRDWKRHALPGVLWFYPREYTSQQQYEQSKYGTTSTPSPKCRRRARPRPCNSGWPVDMPSSSRTFRCGAIRQDDDNYTRDLREDSTPLL